MFTKRSTFGILSLFIALILTFSTLGVTPADAIAGIVVNSNADVIADEGLCTLREAITNANGDSQLYATAGECSAGSGADTISFAANYTITLVGSQLPAVTSTIIINGNSEANTIIEANAAPNTATHRVFEVGAAGNLTLNSLTVRNGRCNSSCATHATSGGGIFNVGTLAVSNVTFSANFAASLGGGMSNYNSSSPTLTNVTFSANSAIYGGGMFNYNSSSPTLTNVTFSANSAYNGGGMVNDTSSPTLTDVTFSANSATNYGGGMYNYISNATLTNVTFSANSAIFGGGMVNYNSSSPTLTNVTFSTNFAASLGGGMANYNSSSPTLTNVTFNTNSASYGGGMFNYNSSPTLTNVTISANSATTSGGGMYNSFFSSPILTNVIIANSVSGGDCYNNSVTLNAASSNNLIEDAVNACGLANAVNGNIIGSDPMLGALTNNGGSTQTHALMAGSPAFNTGTNTGCPATDQRGMTRPQGSYCDIGAYEKAPIFTDVSLFYWSWQYIERLYNAGVTGGCSTVPLNYCPTTPVTRAQMAIFLLRGMHGSTYTPPAATGTKFTDVPLGTFGAAWIEQLAVEGITSGCGGGNYCPTTPVSRAQMAIFLVRAKHGIAFTPPTATGIFTDVPVGSFGADYIEQLSVDSITSGCSSGNYCPNTMVKRDSMAVFLVKTFNLP